MLSANPPQLWIRHAGKINTQTDAKGWSKVLQSNLECLGMEEVASSIQCQSNGGFLPSPPVPISAAWGRAHGSREKHTRNILFSRTHKPKQSCFFEEPALFIDKMPSLLFPKSPEPKGRSLSFYPSAPKALPASLSVPQQQPHAQSCPSHWAHSAVCHTDRQNPW